jgi:lysophospholipase L1-like esterase
MARLSTKQKILVPFAATLVCLAAAEGALRWFVHERLPLGQLSYETATGEPVANLPDAVQRGFIEMVLPPVAPRPRGRFRPGLDFFLGSSDAAALQRPWFDAKGRVPVHINAGGIRDRDDITFDKPEGQRRVVCIGDSFTFGWGVRDEDGWVRLLETDLRTSGRDVRTVNCGASGALCVDEYEWGLRNRFGRFQPDAVVVTLCLNDLIPSSGLFVQGPSPATGLRLVDLLLRAVGRSPLDLDPAVDWVGLLTTLPEPAGLEAGLYGDDKPFAAMWSQGVPQASLRAMKAWCDERKVALMVVLWPFLQGLGPGRTYPFQRLHDEVAEDCSKAGIPFLDVRPALQQTPHEQLWVTPGDMHANPAAHRLAAPAITQFVRAHWSP